MKILEDEFAKLWADCISRHRKLNRSKMVLQRLEDTVKKHHLGAFAKNGGGLYLRRNQSGKLRAAVLIRELSSGATPKTSKYTFSVVTAPGDDVSLDWAKGILNDHLPKQGQQCVGKLEPGQVRLLSWIVKQGFEIRSVQLEGSVQNSLRRLRSHYGKTLRTPFERAGLVIVPASSRRDITPYLRLLKALYRKSPQFGTHVTDPKFLKAMHKDLNEALKRGEKPLWLVRQEGKLLGGVDIFESANHIDGKRRAWFGVNLARELQGKNCSRAVYETILMELHQRGVDRYFGNTGQPGVMRLGKIMGRSLWGMEVDRGVSKSFQRGHFRSWLPKI